MTILKKALVFILSISLFITMNSWKIQAEAKSVENLALNKPVTYSGVEGGKKGSGWTNPHLIGEFVVDGKYDTRWSADKTDNQWLVIDLENIYDLQSIDIRIHAEAPQYQIQISSDNVSYETVFTTTSGTNGLAATRNIDVSGKSARYIKYQQNKMFKHPTNGKFYGSSINEIVITQFKSISTTEKGTIRLGTYNIQSHLQPDISFVKKMISANHLDFLGIQEIENNTSLNNYDMVSSLKSGIFDYSLFSKSSDYLNGETGLASFSKYPINGGHNGLFPNIVNTLQKNYQRNVIHKDGKDIAIYNVQLSHESSAIREQQIFELINLLNTDTNEYKVLLGDFNVINDRSEMVPFLKNYKLINGDKGKWFNTYRGNDVLNKSLSNIIISRNLEVLDFTISEPGDLSNHGMLVTTLKFNDTHEISDQFYNSLLEDAYSVNKDNVTKKSYDNLQVAIQNAQGIFANADSQGKIDEASDCLSSALESLSYINLALNKPVVYSGVEGGKNGENWKYPDFVGEKANDGDGSTRWSADKVDVQSLSVDLGKPYPIGFIFLNIIETSPSYDLFISNDGVNYEKILENRANKNGGESSLNLDLDNKTARYVKYVQNKRFKHSNNQYYGSSIAELQVYKDKFIQTVDIKPQNDVISVGDTLTLKTNIEPIIAVNDLNWSSSNTNVATVNNGVINGVGPGSATITAQSKGNSEAYSSMQIKVVEGDIKVDTIEISESLEMFEKEHRFIDYKLTPSKSVDILQDVRWESLNEDIFTVNDKGLVSAHKVGIGTLKVSLVSNPSIYSEMEIRVIDEPVKESYKVMSDKWLKRIIGDTSLDLSDPDITQYIRGINKEAKNLLETYNHEDTRLNLWDQVSSDTFAANYTTQFNKIKKLALAFGIVGSDYYQDKDVLNIITDSIEYMINTKKYNGTYSSGNWWDWQIGVPQPFVDTLFIIEPYLDNQTIETYSKPLYGYAKRPSIQWGNYTATGANRTDIGIVVLGTGILNRDDARMDLVLEDVPQVFNIVQKGDGIYEDGSLIQHGSIAYSGSYGNELVKGVGRIASITQDTQWQFDETGLLNVVKLVDKGYIPLMFDGKMMAMVNGRSISRAPGTNPFTTEFEAGSETISNVMLVSQFAPKEYKEKFESAIKSWLKVSTIEYDFYTKVRDIEALLVGKQIENDISIKPLINEEKVYIYGSMDRGVQVKDNYSFGISMFSNRVSNYEFGNTENKKGWHTGSGVTYIYNKDYKQYEEGYWPTIDPYHLPGTTVDVAPLTDGQAHTKRSDKSWVGGSSLNDIGSVGMYYSSKHFANSMNTSAKKSWFMLDGVIVAVGSDISGQSTTGIHTTIENRMLNDLGNNPVIISDGSTVEEYLTNKDVSKQGYVILEGDVKDNNISYLFPNQTKIVIGKEKRNGKYDDINSYFINDQIYTKSFLKMYIDHGLDAQSDKYEYVIAPGLSELETQKLSQSNSIKILQNDSNVHSVEDSDNGIFAMNVWNENGASLKGIHVNKASSLTSKLIDNKLTLSISDPSQSLKSLDLSFDYLVDYVGHDSRVIRKNDNTFTINLEGLKGSSMVLELEKVDKTKLETVLNEVRSIPEDMFTSDSYQSLLDSINTGKIILNDSMASQKKVDDSVLEINNKIGLLELNSDYKKLKDLTEKLKEQLNEVTSYWKVKIIDLVSRSEGALDDGLGHEELIDLLQEMQSTIDNLQYPLDFTKSNQLIERFNNTNYALYTSVTWNNLDVHISLLLETISKYDESKTLEINQEYINQINIQVELAFDGLERMEFKRVDALSNLLDEAMSIDRTKYTPESISNLDEAIDNAILVLGAIPQNVRRMRAMNIITQQVIDDAVEKLIKAIDSLVMLEAIPNPQIPGQPSEPNPDNTDNSINSGLNNDENNKDDNNNISTQDTSTNNKLPDLGIASSNLLQGSLIAFGLVLVFFKKRK